MKKERRKPCAGSIKTESSGSEHEEKPFKKKYSLGDSNCW